MPKLLLRIMSHHPLASELALVLVVKMTLLILAGIFLFGADQRFKVDENVMTYHLLEQNSSSNAR